MKIGAATVLQAAIRGAAARKLLCKMRHTHELLSALEAAVLTGQLDLVDQAGQAAAAAGQLVVLQMQNRD